MKIDHWNVFRNLAGFAATVLFVALAVTSCSDRQEPLPGGYFIAMASRSEMFLGEPKYGGNIPELGTDLEEIGHHQEFIFGRNGADRGTKPGYFLLDTKSGSIKAALKESDWLGLTAAAGIPQPPKLLPPARQTPIKR